MCIRDRLYQVCVLNPIKTCQMRKNNVRKTKTDKVDTYVIAKPLMMQDNLRFVSFFDLDMMDLKALGRFRQKTIKPVSYTHLDVNKRQASPISYNLSCQTCIFSFHLPYVFPLS